jgi:WD40 repeat protein
MVVEQQGGLRHLVITVHGIRTFGQWQERLSKLLRLSEPTIAVYNYHYGYFSVIAFMIPFLRWLVTRRFRQALLDITTDSRWDRVDIVAHSFGTHLVAWGLHGMAPERRPDIHTIIFAGSVLKPRFPWRDVTGSNGPRLVNECGIRDNVLVLNQLFVLFSGMAGRVGFTGMTGERYTNRYFDFGHSGYFLVKGASSDEFMHARWVPLLILADPPQEFDQRGQPNALQGLFIWALNNADSIKVTAYLMILAIPTLVYARLYLNAEEQRQIALSRLLASEAVSQLDANPDAALLLSVEATRRYVQPIPYVARHAGLSRYIRKAIVTDEALDVLLTALLHYPHLASLLHGHVGPVWMIAFSPDGKILASASKDHTIRLWDVATHQPLGQPLVGSDEVGSVAFSPDGRTLASSAGGIIWLWDVATRRPLGQRLRSDKAYVIKAAFSPDGKTLASVTAGGTVQLWDVATRQPLGQPFNDHGNVVRNVTFSSDGKTLAASWGVVAYSPDGKVLAASACETVGLWDVATRQALGQPSKFEGYSSANRTFWLCDASSGKPLGSPLTGDNGTVSDVVFSPDGKTLASGSEDSKILIWDTASHQRLGPPLTGHRGAVFSVAFSPDGRSLASSALADNVIRLWDLRHGQLLGRQLTGHVGAVYSLAFSSDGKILASGGEDHTIRLWDVAAGQRLGTLLTNHKSVMTVAFSPDGSTLASVGSGGGDYIVGLWNLAARESLGELNTGQRATISSVAFGPNGKLLAVADYTCRMWLWDVAARQLFGRPLGGQRGCATFRTIVFSADGQMIASADVLGTIQLWDMQTRQPFGRPFRDNYSTPTKMFVGPNGKLVPIDPRSKELVHGGITELAFSPNRKALAVGYADSTIQLWDVATQQRLGRPIGPADRTPASMSGIRLRETMHPLGRRLRARIQSAMSLTYSPDGNVLASGGEDGTILLWDVEIGGWRELACRIANRNLTDKEWERYVGNSELREETCKLATGSRLPSR